MGTSRSITSIENMDVSIYTGASKVADTYKFDDFSIELFLSLPYCHTIQLPTIQKEKKVKLGNGRGWVIGQW